MPDPFASFLATRRGTLSSTGPSEDDDPAPDFDQSLSSVRDLRGTVFDESDPIAQWRKFTIPKDPNTLGTVGKAMGATLDRAFKPFDFVRDPLNRIQEKSLDWAQDEPNPALRYLKAFPGAVAGTVGEMASPVNVASFVTGEGALGAAGKIARGAMSGAQLGEGIPEAIDSARERDWRGFTHGAGEAALGALGVAGDVLEPLQPRTPPPLNTPAVAAAWERFVSRHAPQEPAGLPPAPERLALPPGPDGGGGPDVVDFGRTPDLDRLLGEAPTPRGLPPAPPPQLPPAPRFYQGSEGTVEPREYGLSPDDAMRAAEYPPGLDESQLGTRGTFDADRFQNDPSYSNRTITPGEYLGGANLRGGPSLNPDLEAMLGTEGAVREGQPGLEGFQVLDPFGPGPNASGESAASQEAINRLSGMTSRGERFVVYDRSGNPRPIVGADAVDYVARPGETFGIQGPDGFRVLDDRGGRVVPGGSGNGEGSGVQPGPDEVSSNREATGATRGSGDGTEGRTYDLGGINSPIDLERELAALAGDPVRPDAGSLDGRATPELGAPDAGGLDETGGARNGARGRRIQADPEVIPGDENGLAFRRKTPEDNAARFTPEVRRELERIGAELDNFPYTDRTWNEAPRKSGNAAGGDADIVAGSAGAPVYDDVLGEAPLAKPRNRNGEPTLARQVNGTRGDVAEAIRRALDTNDIHNNLAEGAVRVAERRAAGDWKGLSRPSLPPHWETPREMPADIPQDLSDFIDKLAAEPDKYDALEKYLGSPEGSRFSVRSQAEADNISRNSPFGRGSILQNNMLPTELRELSSMFDEGDYPTFHVKPEGGLEDILDTGEAQPRLPEAGQVRNADVQTPEFDAPFSLSAPKNTAADALDRDLFGAQPAAAAGAPPESLDEISARHDVKSPEKADEIADSMRRVGWKGRPVLVVNDAGKRTAWTATHRLEAAKRAGLKPSDVPMLEINAEQLRSAGYNLDDLTQLGKKKRIEALRAAGLNDAADLLEQERAASKSRQDAAGDPDVPEPLPTNVRDFLARQLKYTPEQIEAMPVSEAVRIGRERIPNPDAPAPSTPARTVQTLPERSTLPDADTFDDVRRARGQQRTAEIQRTAVAPSEPGAVEGAPAPRTPAERQAAGEQLTAKERESLNLPAETRTRGRVSPREQGSSPRQIAKRVEQLDRWMADPTPENFAQWVSEITGQADRVNERQLRGGTGEEKLPPKTSSGEILASGVFPGSQVFANPELLKKIGQFFVSNEPADRLLRGVIGGGIGAMTDQDSRLRGAVLGAVSAMVGPEVGRAVANDFVLLAKGQVPKGLAEVYAKKPRTGDIGVLENIFGTKARTIPDEFAAVRPGLDAWHGVKETGRLDSRAPLLSERLGEGGPAYRDGRLQIKQADFLKPEIKYLREKAEAAGKERPRLASYLNAYADEIAGTMTRSEKFLSENFGMSPKRAGRASTEVANQVYRAGLAFNPGSAVVNRVAQPLLAAPYTGLRNLWKAYAPLSESEKLLSKIERPVDISDVPRAGSRILSKFDELASSLMRFTDNQNRQGVAAAAKLAADQANAPEAVAQAFARDVSEKTQGLLGLLSGNPRWRGPVIKTMKPFTKYPVLFAEWLNDVATHPDPRVRWRTAAMAGAAWSISQATGLDVWDMLSGGARWGGSAILRAAMDLYAHANNDAKDHQILAAPGSGFLDSDVGSLAYPIGLRKMVETGERFYRDGLNTHTRRSPGGAKEDVSPFEDLANMFGVKTTRQTARQDLLNSAFEQNKRAASADAQQSAQAKRDYLDAYDNGDDAGMQAALQQMTPATRKNVVKTRDRDRFDRMMHSAPVKRRPGLRGDFSDLEQTLELPK